MLRQPSLTIALEKTAEKTKRKSSANVQTMRIGDWVCEECGNLNFSFRNECNRCTMKQKLSKKPLKKLTTRKALQDVTNLDITKCENTPPKNLYLNGFESLLLLTPTKEDKWMIQCEKQKLKHPDNNITSIGQFSNLNETNGKKNLINQYDCIGKHCERFLEEFEKHQVIEDVSEFSITDDINSSFQLDQSVAYCIMLLGIDE